MLRTLDPQNENHIHFSYQLLTERYQYAETINIQGLSLGTIPTYEEHQAWLKKNVTGDHYLWENGGVLLAMVFLRKDESCEVSISNEIGVFVLEQYWGQGIGAEALNAMFEKYPHRNLYAKVNPQNTRSERLFQKLGFTHITNIWSRDAKTKSV